MAEIDNEKILAALKSRRWKYRTAEGIAKETRVPVNTVEKVLKESPQQVRVSVMRRRDGKVLYVKKDEVSVIKDLWNGFKLLSKAKVSE